MSSFKFESLPLRLIEATLLLTLLLALGERLRIADRLLIIECCRRKHKNLTPFFFLFDYYERSSNFLSSSNFSLSFLSVKALSKNVTFFPLYIYLI